MIPEYQQRVIDELAELQTKVNKLAAFVLMPTFDNLASVDRHLLVTQLDAMRAYGNILALRINRFKETA